MSQAGDKHDLNATQFAQALAILSTEKEAHVLPRWQKVIFFLLNVSVIGVVVTLLLALQFPDAGEVLFGILGLLFLLLIAVFAFNIPLVFKLARRMRLIRKLGLYGTLQSPWKESRRKSRMTNFVTIIAAIIGGLVLLVGLFAIIGMFIEGIDTDIIVGIVTFVLIGLSFLSIFYVRRNKQRLETLARLQKSLSRHQEGFAKDSDVEIEISQKDYELIAHIERAQISRHRVESIVESLGNLPDVIYSVRKSESFRKTVSTLDYSEQLAVENQIDSLMTKLPSANEHTAPERSAKRAPSQLDSSLEDGDNVERLPVPGTDLVISYSVDKKGSQIQVIGLRKASAA